MDYVNQRENLQRRCGFFCARALVQKLLTQGLLTQEQARRINELNAAALGGIAAIYQTGRL